jgi:uncharacterized protein YjcR
MALGELRSKAFHVWYSSGCNLSESLRRLAAEDYSVTRQTLASWRDEDNWQDRAARLDSELQLAKDAEALTEDDTLLASLKRQHEQYENYFETLEKPDPQATYAHNGLIKTIQEVAQRTAQYRRAVFAEYFKDMINFFRRCKPELATALENEFEAYLAYIRANNG